MKCVGTRALKSSGALLRPVEPPVVVAEDPRLGRGRRPSRTAAAAAPNALAAIAAARIVGGSGATDLSGCRKSASGVWSAARPPIPSRLLAERAVVPVQQFLGVRVRPERGEDRRAARLAEHADVVRRAVDDRASAAQHRNFVSPSIFWAAQAPTSAMMPPRRAARC